MTPIQFKIQYFRLFVGALMVVLAGLSTQSLAAYEFVTQFGSTGTASGQFAAPRGVTVNHQGKIVISESGNNRMQLCDEQGSCSGFGSFGVLSGEFDRPRGVAVNSADRIFIADRGNSRIESCSSTGSCTDFGGSGTAVGKFASPRGVALDNQDMIYITDTGNNRVQICNAQGSCTAFGSLGTGLTRFDSPAGIGIDSQGRVIVADRGNSRIKICTTSGTCTAFGSFGAAPGQFDGPAGIAIDSQDRIIVVDRFNNRIQVCTDQGSCSVFGSFGTGAGQFNLPWGVAVDSQDRIIVADLGNDRIQVFAESAAPAVQITSFTASPGTIEEGQSTTLSWTVSNATSCTALAGTSNWRALSPNASSGTAIISIATAASYTFTLQCTDGVTTDSASAGVTVTGAPGLIEMNAGLNDAWFYPVTGGQGFFITVFPDLGLVTLSWFTYDTVRPAEGVTANLDEPGHRWLNALGTYSGNQAVMDIDIASGGIFDTATDIQHTDPAGSDGTIILSFSDCENGTVEYDIPSIGQKGTVSIQRIVPDNVALCETLASQVGTQQSSTTLSKDGSNTLSPDEPVTAAELPLLVDMNAGLNDAWFYPVTGGQGFFITVFPDLGLVTLSWFTYDTVRPAEGVTANLDEPGHRWLNALGTYSGNQAVMDIDIASGGIFDTATDIQHTDPAGSDGTIILTFSDCENGMVEYDIPSINQKGIVPIQRIVPDNVALCGTLALP